jgi:tRNA-binding protein
MVFYFTRECGVTMWVTQRLDRLDARALNRISEMNAERRGSRSAAAGFSAANGARSMADPITYADFAKLELRVAKVLEVRPHPNADRLLLVQVDLGDEQKQIVAGIRQHYSPEQLVGKLIVIVNNLEPAMLRGESSNGMLLAATSDDKVVVLTVDDPTCAVGAKIK